MVTQWNRERRNDVIKYASDMIRGAIGTLRDMERGVESYDQELEQSMLRCIVQFSSLMSNWSVLDNEQIQRQYLPLAEEVETWRNDLREADPDW